MGKKYNNSMPDLEIYKTCLDNVVIELHNYIFLFERIGERDVKTAYIKKILKYIKQTLGN